MRGICIHVYIFALRIILIFLSLHTDICKPVRQVAQPAVGIASNASNCCPHLKTEAVFTCDLVTLTFDLSNSKWGHGSALSWALFLPIFSFLCASVLDLVSGTGETDRRTTATNA